MFLPGQQQDLQARGGAHDAETNREQLANEQVEYLIKWNPRFIGNVTPDRR